MMVTTCKISADQFRQAAARCPGADALILMLSPKRNRRFWFREAAVHKYQEG